MVLEQDTIELLSYELTDKFGFNDGDMLGPWLEAWAYRNWPAQISEIERNFDHPVWAYVCDRRLLVRVVSENLVGKLPPEYAKQVYVAHGLHNPIRLGAPEGIEEATWLMDFVADIEPIRVRITYDEVSAVADEMFPERSLGWLYLHDALTWEVQLIHEMAMPGLVLWREPAVKLADKLHNQIGDEASRLLSELLRTRLDTPGPEGLTESDLYELARVAKVCCS